MKLTVNDIMERCNASQQTVYRWIKRGYLKATRLGTGRAHRFEVEPDDFEAFLRSGHYIGHPENIMNDIPFTRVMEAEQCYPVNLLISCLAIGTDDEEDEPRDIWEYDIRKFRNLITNLNDSEQRVIQLRYQYGLTLDEAGKALGKTRERIRQIQAKAERKLRHWSATSGITVVSHEKYDKLKSDYQEALARISDLVHQLEAIKTVQEPEEKKPVNPDFVSLEEMDFNVRCYNCLKRAGFETLGDILAFDQHQGDNQYKYASWYHIRNLGNKSLTLIARTVFDYCGYRLQSWVQDAGYIGLIPIAPNDVFCQEDIYTGEDQNGNNH